MPLVAAAVCPFPPLLVPAVAAGAAAEVAPLLAACDAAVEHLAGSGAERLVVIGPDTATRQYSAPFHGTFAPWGVPVEVHLGGPGRPGRRLPLSLLIGAWLVARGRVRQEVVMTSVDRARGPVECRTPTAMLVLGDGSACRGLKAPGYDDPRAEPYDAAVSRALAAVDLDALDALDPELSDQLQVTGRAPWQVLSATVRAAGGGWRGELTYDAAPYGVQYTVATWTRR